LSILALRVAPALLVLAGLRASGAAAQSNIPLQLITLNHGGADGQQRLQVNVGINGGEAKPYLFDTGSAIFNAAYNPAWWGGVPSSSSLPTNLLYCYGSGIGGCRGFTGNLVQVQSLSFGNNVTLAANPGYIVSAATSFMAPAQGSSPAVNLSFPSYFATNSAPPLEAFYGVFGAGNFASLQQPGIAPPGGVPGQTIVPGLAQGYVVAANNGETYQGQGQKISVIVGGKIKAVTGCSPCVTVGLTPQMLGQFIPVGLPASNPFAGKYPANPTLAGAVPVLAGPSFNNPYGSGPGNNGSIQFGATFNMSLSAPGQRLFSQPAPTLLDSGTAGLELTPAAAGLIGNGTALSAQGRTLNGATIPGLATYTATINDSSATYTAGVSVTGNDIFGISFFLQNSVLYDLSDNAIGYVPFFVTDADLATTTGGPLFLSGGNVPLGLAGVISGPGGLLLASGGIAQLSATNTYTGPTLIAAGGQLYISGPGSIAASSGVMNNGLFDISRAWLPVAIQALTGNGLVSLGSQTLIITNAAGTFAGTIADGGAYPGVGGSVTIAGGNQTFSGNNTYTGGTLVAAGSLTLTGSMIGSLGILPGATFNSTGGYSVAPGQLLVNDGTFQSLGGASLASQGLLINNGQLNSNVVSSGFLAGNGIINGNVMSSGITAPGTSIGTLTVSGNYTQTPSGSYLAETNAQGQSDKLNIGGTATLAGTLTTAPQPGVYAPRTNYTLLTAQGGVNGAYTNVTSPYAFLQPTVTYDANNAYLALTINGFLAAAQNPVQAAVGGALDGSVLQASGDYAQVLGQLATLTPSQVQPILTSLSGMNYSGFSNSMAQTAQLFMSNFSDMAGGTNRTSKKVAIAEACDVACDSTEPAKWGAWGGGLGGLGTVGSGSSLGGVTYNVGGFAGGLDRRFTDNFLAGVTVGYTTGSQWVSGFSGQGFSNTVDVGVYGSWLQGPVYVDGIVGYAYSANQLNRSVNIPGMAGRTAVGQAGANQAYGQVEGGYRVDIGGNAEASITPFARLQGYTGTQGAFTESGAQSLNLNVAAQTTNSLRTVLGAQLGGAMNLGWRDKLLAQLRLGWSHEYADTTRPVSVSFVGAPASPFTTFGVSPTRDGVVVGFTTSTAVADAASIYVRYEGNIAGQDSSHALTAGFRVSW
jgi:autotransporter-associated beta strand protein